MGETGGDAGGPGPGWVRVAAAADVPPGGLMPVDAGNERIVLAHADDGICAVEDRCSHQDFPLSSGQLDGCELECPYHGAAFDVRTGRATRLPAVRPVRTFTVEVRDDSVYVKVG